MPESSLLRADPGAVRSRPVTRPDKLNALNAATLDSLMAAFDEAADDGVRIVRIDAQTGAFL